MATEPLARLLKDNADLVPVRDRLERITRLQERFRALAPEPLSRACRVCAIDGTTVVVRADNAPVAAALRAMVPRLLSGLNAAKPMQDQELTSMRVEVQVASRAPRKPVVSRGQMPREVLAAVAAGLSDSPLKDALTRISRAQSSKTRSKT
jgi:hypothetical protein